MRKISGNKLLVKALKEEGVDTLLVIRGHVRLISAMSFINREISRSFSQDTSRRWFTRRMLRKIDGKVGVCLVTSGPGATNLVTGLATANYDSVPLVCFTGQVARHLIGNDAFQEVDIVGITRSITKYGVTVHRREDLGRIIKEAFYIARSGNRDLFS